MTKFKKNKTRKGGRHNMSSRGRASRRVARGRSSSRRKTGKTAAQPSKEYAQKMAKSWTEVMDETTKDGKILDSIIKSIDNGIKVIAYNDEIQPSLRHIDSAITGWVDNVFPKFAQSQEDQEALKTLQEFKKKYWDVWYYRPKDAGFYFSNDDEKAIAGIDQPTEKRPFTDEHKKGLNYYLTKTEYGKKHLAEIKERAEINIEQLQDEKNKLNDEERKLNPNNNITEGAGTTHDCDEQTLKKPLTCNVTKCPKWRAKIAACKSWNDKKRELAIVEQKINSHKLLDSLKKHDVLKEEGVKAVEVEGGKRKKRTRRRRKKRKRTKKRRKRRR